jgi:hypothetical protein
LRRFQHNFQKGRAEEAGRRKNPAAEGRASWKEGPLRIPTPSLQVVLASHQQLIYGKKSYI